MSGAYCESMAPHVTTVLSVARTGTRVVRLLIRPARPGQGPARPGAPGGGPDPWLPQTRAQQGVARGADLARRGLGLGVLVVVAVLGAVLSALVIGVLLLGAVAGDAPWAGWLALLTLVVTLLGFAWVVRRSRAVLHPGDVTDAAPAPLTDDAGMQDEAGLLRLLRRHERALPLSASEAFRSTVLLTRDALRLTAGDQALTRETYEVRRAAREDLPELLDAYHSVPPSPQSDAQLLEHLHLIGGRMQAIVTGRRQGRQLEQTAHSRYLQEQYGAQAQAGVGAPQPEPVQAAASRKTR